jgi:hypothetical protein
LTLDDVNNDEDDNDNDDDDDDKNQTFPTHSHIFTVSISISVCLLFLGLTIFICFFLHRRRGSLPQPNLPPTPPAALPGLPQPNLNLTEPNPLPGSAVISADNRRVRYVPLPISPPEKPTTSVRKLPSSLSDPVLFQPDPTSTPVSHSTSKFASLPSSQSSSPSPSPTKIKIESDDEDMKDF